MVLKMSTGTTETTGTGSLEPNLDGGMECPSSCLRLSVNERFRGAIQITSGSDFHGHVKCQIGNPLPKVAILYYTRPFLRIFSMKEVVEGINMINFA